MGLFNRKTDPISERARELNAQIAELESRIQRLNEEVAHPQPRYRSTALPATAASTRAKRSEPIFEEVPAPRLKGSPGPQPRQPGEIGVRKSSLRATWRRLKTHFRPPAASNPRLVSYLAAGSIQGLRPLRYEKRVARNRFVFLVAILLLVLWGVITAFVSP